MTGDRIRLPDGRDAIECERSGGLLRAMPIVEGWPWPVAPVVAAIHLCTPLPLRYLGGGIPRQSDD